MSEFNLKEIKTFPYQSPAIDKGYANQTLYVNLSDLRISIKPVTDQMKQIFVGGKGFDLWLLWNAVKSKTKWNHADNAICIACGPLGGTPIYPGSGKSIVTSISPLTGTVVDSNVGGHFGPFLKFSGFDALEIQGKASKETVIFIDGIDRKIRIFEVSGLPEGAYETSDISGKESRATFLWFRPDRGQSTR
jgi:aldehyde:ferredoxin oxidoreductase